MKSFLIWFNSVFFLDFEFSVLLVQFELKVDLKICGLPAFLSLYGLSDYFSEVVR